MLELRRDLGHSTARWIRALFAIVDHSDDLKTVGAWGRAVGASPAVVRSICLLANVSPKQSLDFGRVLRVVIRGQVHVIAELLDVDDPRTVRRLLVSAGALPIIQSGRPLSVKDFIQGQFFIENGVVLDAVRIVLGERGLL